MEKRFQLTVVEETGSTNEDLKKQTNAPHGTALLARRQTGGKGRLGRQFSSPEGGVYLSLLLRPKAKPGELLHLTAMAAVAVRRAIWKLCGLQTQIKWTNDLVYEGKKLCGILTELVTGEGGALQSIIIGVGLNCNTRTEEFPPELEKMATSLAQVTGRSFDIPEAAGAVLQELWEMDRVLFSEKASWLREYEKACVTLGKQVRIIRGKAERCALALGIDENGGLLVRYEDGTEGTVQTGEVSVRGMYGYLE